ncbi:hypothetical protein PTKIN_Ptkin01aG0076300 [Pterospermum kingtungense]
MAARLLIRGVIPEEILDLSFLTFLGLDQNFFTGPLPAFIGNMSRLDTLLIDRNGFNGSIPKELGNLKELFFLSIGNNNFSGTLPPELGNLVNLKIYYMNSCGLDGEIPSTFANLEKLHELHAANNAFRGKIPDFIGNNWTNLTVLMFEGNSFEGPIPSTFANLTSLTKLRIGGIYNGSSSLDFLRNLKNLTILVLRNVLLTGIIPPHITELRSLQMLDLSFNNLTGQIPSALFNMNSLEHLFLGSNSLSGTLPSQKIETLQTIDVSYNLLSGNLPSWIDSSLQLNFVANNFTLTSSNLGLFPGLECLQRSFPCNRSTPQYKDFSIKCGGPQFFSNGILFEGESGTLGAATFNVTNSKWAVSNVGLFSDTQNQLYLLNTQAQVKSTYTPYLYQTSRLSPGSLRYYGLGLVNGLYTVNLFFSETGFRDPIPPSWKSLERRVFDVYIQGTRQLRDFDISKAAGGVDREIIMNFTANVSENYLEIHLFWAGKGSCCFPSTEPGYYGPLISALSVVRKSNEVKNRTVLIVVIVMPVAIIALVLIFAILYFKRRKEDDKKGLLDSAVLLAIGPRPNTFSYDELKAATEDFNPSNKLGEGGFGAVYKGNLSDGRFIAVKQLLVASHQGKSQFIAEVATISAVQHRNLVKLYGCCIEEERHLLVYEYLENKSLDQALWGRSELNLDWPTRFNICLATARGLAYLHEDSRPRIVHRDIKASNILLDAKLCPKISDFGLAKLYDDQKTHISTRVAGTIGYLAPEYAMRGHLTEKADVFGFGIVALEILSGRPNSDKSLEHDKIYLLEWAWALYENNQSLDLVDPSVVDFDENEALRMVQIALLCTQGSPTMRPPMSRVVAMLAGDVEVSGVITRPSYLTDWDFKDLTSKFGTEDKQTSTAFENKDNNNQITIGINAPELSDIVEGR